MEGVRSKVITAVLTAVLIFNVLVPVPIGVKSGSDFRYGTAEANEAVAIPIVGTVLLAYGFYICANNEVDYGTALETAWSDLCTFADNSGIMDASTLQGAIASAVTSSGSVYLDILNDTALPALLTAWANDGVTNGTIGEGTNSMDGMVACGSLGGVSWTYGYPPASFREDFPAIANQYDAGWFPFYMMETDGRYKVCFCQNPEISIESIDSSVPRLITENTGVKQYFYGHITSDGNGFISGRKTTQIYLYGNVVLSPGMSIVYDGNIIADNGSTASVLGSASQALLDGYSEASYPTGTYQAFTPTAAQLQSGYDSTALVEAIEGGTEVATDISGSVSQILTQVTGLSDVFGDLRTQVQTLVTDFASQLAWSGAESFPNVMNTVIDGLGDISGGIEQGVSDLLDGLADIPGADVLSPSIDAILDGINELVNPVTVDIPAMLEGVQEGVLSIPDAIEVGLADVISAVNAQTLDISGAIESAISPFLRDFNVPEGDGTPIALPGSIHSDLEMALEDKVPFCYVIRSQDALNNMFTSFASNRSFYFDVQLPYAEDTVRFDAEPFLSQPFGAFDIATTLKIIFTALLCFGLLWRSYKMIERLVM